FHSTRDCAFAPLAPVDELSTAAHQVPSRCGWVLPSVQQQIEVFGSASETVQRPRERSSRCASDASKFFTIWNAVGAAALPTALTVMSLIQPSSWPLPLQPAHRVRWLTPFASETTSPAPSPDWCISQSSLFFCMITTCFCTWPFAFCTGTRLHCA